MDLYHREICSLIRCEVCYSVFPVNVMCSCSYSRYPMKYNESTVRHHVPLFRCWAHHTHRKRHSFCDSAGPTFSIRSKWMYYCFHSDIHSVVITYARSNKRALLTSERAFSIHAAKKQTHPSRICFRPAIRHKAFLTTALQEVITVNMHSQGPLLRGGNITLEKITNPTDVATRQTKIIVSVLPFLYTDSGRLCLWCELTRFRLFQCTLGPACWEVEQLEELIDAGLSVARFNFSHGDHEGHLACLNRLRQASKNKNKHVAGTFEEIFL